MFRKISVHVLVTILLVTLLSSQVLSASAKSYTDEKSAPETTLNLSEMADEEQPVQQEEEQTEENIALPEGESSTATLEESASVAAYNAENFYVRGLLGVGTDRPVTQFGVVGGSSFQGGRNHFQDHEGKGRVRVGAAWGIPGFYSEDGQDLVVGVAANKKVLLGGLNNWMVVQGTGNVGIGTFSPQAKLDVIGTTRTSVLQITGGADIAEPFVVQPSEALEPGMVVAIDPNYPGELRLANQAYDRLVAGVISGAGGIQPGLVLQQEGTIAAGEHPVALTGRVYVWADASHGVIVPGDQLTTSGTPGHAMKVTDHAEAQGAILGKAMSGLEKGTGLVLMLVTLQ